jgi:formylglycine-generating enzyme required for sulfatase activity/tetratricopeptide (TPR) repeat protein
MSNYVWGSRLSYQDYIKAKQFAGDITGASREDGRRVYLEISRQTLEIVASREALAREQINVVEQSARSTREGFKMLSYGITEISSSISELNATFHWGFSDMLAQLGHMNDTLSELVKSAKTPLHAVAFNHFELARDAFRQGLYKEALEELDKAVSGDYTSPGYRLEWRFHHLRGIIRLSFTECDFSLVKLAEAEQAFLAAARYAQTDYPQDAGRAFLSAGWASYCQGKMADALAHTEQAMSVHPGFSEAFFQAAKILMYQGNTQNALSLLGKAIESDRFYALKAAGDGDFKKHDVKLRNFLEAMRREKYRQLAPKIAKATETLRGYMLTKGSTEVKDNLEKFLSEGTSWPLMDILGLDAEWNKIAGKEWVLISKLPDFITSAEQLVLEAETYQEKACVKPDASFRKMECDMETKTRMVKKKILRKYTTEVKRFEIRSFNGPVIADMDFCRIPAGTFFMGEQETLHQVTLTKDFYLARYPITQALWQTIMGNNPSHFKGENHPVDQVSWEDVQEFIANLNERTGENLYRLPTEAEWEYACRSGSSGTYSFGDDEKLLGEYAWFNNNSEQKTHPVGGKKPNAWGLYDMHGNVWEWCQDWHGDYPQGSVTDPVGLSSGSRRVFRGGSWFYGAGYCRSAIRFRCAPSYGYIILGFRLAASPVW